VSSFFSPILKFFRPKWILSLSTAFQLSFLSSNLSMTSFTNCFNSSSNVICSKCYYKNYKMHLRWFSRPIMLPQWNTEPSSNRLDDTAIPRPCLSIVWGRIRLNWAHTSEQPTPTYTDNDSPIIWAINFNKVDSGHPGQDPANSM